MRGVRKINNSEKLKKKQVLYGEYRNLCMWKSSLRKKPLLIFCAMVFRARVFFPHIFRRGKFSLCSRGAREYTLKRDERDEEVVKKEIFCSCVHYKANTSIHICSHLGDVWSKNVAWCRGLSWRKILGTKGGSGKMLLERRCLLFHFKFCQPK